MAKITRMRTVDAASGYQVGTVKLESIPTQRSAALESKKRLEWDKPFNLLCQWCDARFTAPRFKMFCGITCRNRAYQSKRLHFWSQDELDYLAGLIGTYCYQQIIDKFRAKFQYSEDDINNHQLQNKLIAIAKSEGMRIKDRDDNLSVKQWGDLLGVPSTTFTNWINQHVKYHKISYGLKIVRRADLKSFALKHPLWLDDVDCEKLLWLFDGDLKPLINAAKLAVAESRFGPRKRREVFCVETGQMFNSIQAAGQHCGCSSTTMKARIESRQAVWLPVSVRTNEKVPFHFAYYFNLVHGWGKKYG